MNKRKIIMFLRLNWGKLLVGLIALALLYFSFVFIRFVVSSYFDLEESSRRMYAGNVAVFLPMFLLVYLISMPLMIGLQYYFLYGGFNRMFTRRMSKAKVNVRWGEVIGMESAKEEAWEIVKLLKDRHLVKSIGGKVIKGTLMIGPPGCGKTYLAKAIATECGLPFLPAVGSDFVGMIVGQGAAQMRGLFQQARALASMEGGCIIFIDEIDSFARPRQQDRGFGGAISHNATINQFLTEMDGLRQTENNIVVLAATNVAEYELDSAIMRSGRFDRKIYVHYPNLKDREQVFNFYLKKVRSEENVSAKILSRKALGFSPADIENMIREASLIGARDKRSKITMRDLSEAYDRVIFGMKSNITLNKQEKEWTAYHEAGHAIIGYLLHPTDDIIKATIVPRKGALGMVSHRPAEDRYCPNRDELMADIKVSVASYVSEKLTYGKTSSGVGGGVGSDFNKAMRLARNMVWSYGMGESGLIGDFEAMAHHSRFGSEYAISEKTKEILDHDVQKILKDCLLEVTGILEKNKDLLNHFAKNLLDKGELEYDEIIRIFDDFNLKPLTRPRLDLS